MGKNVLPEELRKKLQPIMRDHGLAKFGDTLTNFIYSLAKTNVQGEAVGIRVYDKALAEVIRQTGLRSVMQSSSSSGDLGDGTEALLGYAYLNEIMTIEEMVALIISYLETVPKENLIERSKERENMIESFVKIVEEIIERIKQIIE
ncbi:MAG TPA: ribonuclease III family protein [Candidatus Bathyarchaeia archaeon]|nr:ribonuclease III family protein [Candidatus Bathyarchaeia archaeon]